MDEQETIEIEETIEGKDCEICKRKAIGVIRTKFVCPICYFFFRKDNLFRVKQ